MESSGKYSRAWQLRAIGVLLLALGFGFTYLPTAPDIIGIPLVLVGLGSMVAGIILQLRRA